MDPDLACGATLEMARDRPQPPKPSQAPPLQHAQEAVSVQGLAAATAAALQLPIGQHTLGSLSPCSVGGSKCCGSRVGPPSGRQKPRHRGGDMRSGLLDMEGACPPTLSQPRCV